MSAAKHTQGPWEAFKKFGRGWVVQRGDEGGFVVEGSTPEREEADAHLIAAAPELRDIAAQAEEFTELVERFFRGGDGIDTRGPATESEVAEAMYALRAAIAKAATGNAS